MITTPWTGLLDSLADAIARRAGSWPPADRANGALEVARADLAAAEADPFLAVADLARFCALDEFDVAILVAAAAAEVDPTIHLLTGLLSGDEGPGRPTVALAAELAGVPIPSAEGRARFADSGALRRSGLLELGGTTALPARRCRVPDRVAAALLGDDRPATSVRPLLVLAHPVAVAGTTTLARALEAGERFVWVHSPIGGAGLAMATAACQELSVPWLAADLSLLPGTEPAPPADDAAGPAVTGRPGPDPVMLVAVVRELLLEAAVGGRVLVLTQVGNAAPIIDAVASAALPVVLVSDRPWNPLWAATLPVTITAPRLTVAQRGEVWRSALGSPPEADVAALRLTPEQIESVARSATTNAALAGSEHPDSATIRDAVRRLATHNAGPGGAPVGLDDLVLPDHTRAEIERLLVRARYRDELTAVGPLRGRGSGICALFSGGPGTGKTLAAHVIADALALDLHQVDLAGVVSKYIGETEKNLEQVFATAESMNALLFFDEADALFGSRSEIKDSRDRYANTEIAYLLQRMEAFDGITVLATNLRGNLDAAFARRLHFIVHFPDPDAPTRRRLWEAHLAVAGPGDPDDPVDLDLLAGSVELAGGDIRNIVLSAVFTALGDGHGLGMRAVVDATVREYTKLGRRAPAELLR